MCGIRANLLLKSVSTWSYYFKYQTTLLFIIVIYSKLTIIKYNPSNFQSGVSQNFCFICRTIKINHSYFQLENTLLHSILMKACPLGIYIIAYSHNRNPRGERIDYIFLSSLALIKDLRDSPPWEDELYCFICMPHLLFHLYGHTVYLSCVSEFIVIWPQEILYLAGW